MFIDGSVIEYFDFPDYRVKRIYHKEADLTDIAEFREFPYQAHRYLDNAGHHLICATRQSRN